MTEDDKKKLDLPECFGDPKKYRHTCKCGNTVACVMVCIQVMKDNEQNTSKT